MPPVASTTARAGNGQRRCRRRRRPAQSQPGDARRLGQQRFGDVAFDHADRGRRTHGLDQRRDDRLAGHVAAHMHDAPRGMRGFAADRELALEVAVERHAVVRAGRGCAPPASRASPSAIASSTRPAPAAIVSAACASGAVAFGDRRRNAALRPRRRGALAERRRGNHRDRTRRQLQRAEQAGKAAADDDDIVGLAR